MIQKRSILVYLLVLLVFSTRLITAQERQLLLLPMWSPDGNLIAYVTNDGIHVIEQDGTNDRLISPPAGLQEWTSDSSGLILTHNNYPTTPSITWWVYPIDGSEPTQLFPEFDIIYDIAYSYDGKQIAISAKENESEPNQIWIGDMTSSSLEPIAEYSSFQITWTPDNSAIQIQTRLEKVDGLHDATVTIPISGNTEPVVLYDLQGTIPLGDGIAVEYDSDRSYLPASHYLTDLRIDDSTTLTVNALVADLVYSDVSDTIAYVEYCTPSDVSGSFLQGEWSAEEQIQIETALFTIDVETGELTEAIACGSGSQISLSFSSDGTRLLFVRVENGEWELYMLDIANPTTVTRIA